MNKIADLDVMSIAERVYQLQHDVEAEPMADGATLNDWVAVRIAVAHLQDLVAAKFKVRDE
jgi:hypothetical protein